jgi:hypothetical protein
MPQNDLEEELAIQRIAAKYLRTHPSLGRFMKDHRKDKFFLPTARFFPSCFMDDEPRAMLIFS